MKRVMKMRFDFHCLNFLATVRTYKMEFVCNANFKGDCDHCIDLEKLKSIIPNSKLHAKPHQLVVKDPKGTLIFFGTGKFRIMGCIDELKASLLVCTYLEKAIPFPFISFPFITLQSYTLRSTIGFRINLTKMSSDIPCIYEPELFPALRLREYKPISVNLFTTGKVIVSGIPDPNELHAIMKNLHLLCEPYKI